jgi:hypothetical protein
MKQKRKPDLSIGVYRRPTHRGNNSETEHMILRKQVVRPARSLRSPHLQHSVHATQLAVPQQPAASTLRDRQFLAALLRPPPRSPYIAVLSRPYPLRRQQHAAHDNRTAAHHDRADKLLSPALNRLSLLRLLLLGFLLRLFPRRQYLLRSLQQDSSIWHSRDHLSSSACLSWPGSFRLRPFLPECGDRYRNCCLDIGNPVACRCICQCRR